MQRQSSVFAMVAALALAGCSTDVVAPIKAPLSPSFAVGAGASSGSYIVLFNGKGIPADFSDRVAALGAVHHLVLDADVGEGATHHDFVIAAPRAIGIEILLADLALLQIDAGR